MQMGRRIEAFHKAILHFMSANEIPACDENYIYERSRRKCWCKGDTLALV